MHHITRLLICIAFLGLTACEDHKSKPADVSALPGTNTVIVGIPLDQKGYPMHTVGTITIKPGQKILFAGPENFFVFFKNGVSPYNESDLRNLAGLNREGLQKNRVELRSINGLVEIVIPKDLFERAENKGKPYIDYYYGINVNGLEIDPPVRVIPN